MGGRRQTRRALVVGALGLALVGCRGPAGASSTAPERPDARVDVAPPDEPVGHDVARERARALHGEAALGAYARLLKIDSGDPLAGLGVAQTGLEFGYEGRAEELLRHAVDLDRTQAVGGRLGLALLGFASYERDGGEEAFVLAEEQLRNVLAVEPDNPHALAQAVALYLVRAERRADIHAPLARVICEDHEPIHANLAASCAEEAWRRGDPARARELFARATGADPEHHGAWMRWGMLELGVGNVRSARGYFEHATGSPWPSMRISAHTMLGVALDQLGDTSAATAAYRAARDVCERSDRPLPPDLLFNLGVAASRIAETEAALDEARAILEQYLASADPSAVRRLQVEQALAELRSIRAEQQRAQ